jgi:hypothetical protein
MQTSRILEELKIFRYRSHTLTKLARILATFEDEISDLPLIHEFEISLKLPQETICVDSKPHTQSYHQNRKYGLIKFYKCNKENGECNCEKDSIRVYYFTNENVIEKFENLDILWNDYSIKQFEKFHPDCGDNCYLCISLKDFKQKIMV